MTRLALTILTVTTFVMVTSPVSATEGADTGAGRLVFEANCAMCHGTDAAGMMGIHPSLRGAIERLTREGVEVTIRNGRDTTPPMPAYGDRLTDRQIMQVIDYIDTLPPGPRNFGPETTGRGMMDGMMDGMMGGWLWLLPLVVLIAIVLAVLAIVRWSCHPRDPSPREALDRRYATGELDRDEYLRRRNDLER